MTDEQRVPVAKAKGRPMLSWVGKRPLREVRAFPSQLVERFAPATPDGIVGPDVDWSEWPERFDRGGLLFHGDNKEVLAHLLATGFRGKVDLVYIDPPFDSGADYVRKVQLRGASGSARSTGRSAPGARSLADALIAATAWNLGATLVTRTPRDFKRLGIPVMRYA